MFSAAMKIDLPCSHRLHPTQEPPGGASRQFQKARGGLDRAKQECESDTHTDLD